jgi:hypothetical protein
MEQTGLKNNDAADSEGEGFLRSTRNNSRLLSKKFIEHSDNEETEKENVQEEAYLDPNRMWRRVPRKNSSVQSSSVATIRTGTSKSQGVKRPVISLTNESIIEPNKKSSRSDSWRTVTEHSSSANSSIDKTSKISISTTVQLSAETTKQNSISESQRAKRTKRSTTNESSIVPANKIPRFESTERTFITEVRARVNQLSKNV